MKIRSFIKYLLCSLETHSGIQIFPRDRILSAVSKDGLAWEREDGIRIDVKGNSEQEMVYYCSVIQSPAYLRMYFHASQNINGEWKGNILSATSGDGLLWSQEEGRRVTPHGDGVVTSPCVVKMGDLYRMYYAEDTQSKQFSIFSAISKDGLHWSPESGVRISPETHSSLKSVRDPAIIQTPAGWRMYFSGITAGETCIYSAFSSNGIRWSFEPGTRLSAGAEGRQKVVDNPSILRLNDRLLRMYFRGADRNALGACIYSALSEDGLRWKVEPGVRLTGTGYYEAHGVECPHALILPDGTFRLYYTGYFGKHLLNWFTMRQYQYPHTIIS